MTETLQFQTQIHFRPGRRGCKRLAQGPADADKPAHTGRVPRIARLMALAIRFEQLIRDGVVSDQADLARLAQVSRARITQIMNLLFLAPDIQEALLFLPRIERGRDTLHLAQLQPIARVPEWGKQRQAWKKQRTHYFAETERNEPPTCQGR